jgi:hypothetical protein
VTLVTILIGRMFVRVVKELKTCYIYETILRSIKIVAHSLLGESNFIA